MTETMIERVALAICCAVHDNADYGMRAEDVMSDRDGRDHFIALARAAIAALREPPEVMMDEGVDCRQHDGGVTHVPAP